MNDIALLREAAPEAPALTTDVRHAARAALMAEIDSARPRRARMPSRKARWRIGTGLVVVAASWAAAVVIAGPGSPDDSVQLVDFETPTFPLSLDPAPEGLRPAFTGDATGASFAEYVDAQFRTAFTMSVSEDEPALERVEGDSLSLGREEQVRVDDREARLVHGSHPVPCEDGLSMCGTREFTWLAWEFQDDVWVHLEGDGAYGDADRLIEVAESVVERPQRATLTAELAPAGWSLEFFKMGRVLVLVNDDFEQQSLTVHVPLPEDAAPLDAVRESIMGPVGPAVDVTVKGRPAVLVRVDNGPMDRGWFLQAQFEDGTTYTLQVPDAFTQEQVLEFAEAVTYNS
jgi:hypothetical protein